MLAKEVIKKTMSFIPASRNCECSHALEHAIITERKKFRANQKKIATDYRQVFKKQSGSLEKKIGYELWVMGSRQPM